MNEDEEVSKVIENLTLSQWAKIRKHLYECYIRARTYRQSIK